MSVNDELRADLFDDGENLSANAVALVLTDRLVTYAKDLDLKRDQFLREVRARLEALKPVYEDRTLLKPPTEQAFERYKRLVDSRLRRTQVHYGTLSILLTVIADVIMKRGMPVDLTLAMIKSSWDGTPIITAAPSIPDKRTLNGN